MQAEQSVKLLQNVQENARSGLEAIRILMDKTNDQGLRGELLRQQQVYGDIERRAQEALNGMGATPTPVGVLEDLGMRMGIGMNMMTDKSPSHVADMLIQGGAMGMSEMQKMLNQCPEAAENAKTLAQNFLSEQQKSIDSAKTYL